MSGHRSAARKLDKIISRSFGLIFDNLGKISEHDVAEFVLAEFKKNNLAVDKKIPIPIVAFGTNTQFVHYHPGGKSRIIKRGDLIMLDIWAREKRGGPFADITRMGFAGKQIPQKYRRIFALVAGARDEAVKFVRRRLKNEILPVGAEVDGVARGYFKKHGLDKYFLHGLGHVLGESDCHGDGFRLAPGHGAPLRIGVPFTVEPGLYFKNKFGARSEIDCLIDKNYRLAVTTKIQRQILCAKR